MAVKTLYIAYQELADKYNKLKSLLTPAQLSKLEREPQPTVLGEEPKTKTNKPTEQPEDIRFKGYSFKGW